MVDIVTRESKGVSLTWEEMDSNWQNLKDAIDPEVTKTSLAGTEQIILNDSGDPKGVTVDTLKEHVRVDLLREIENYAALRSYSGPVTAYYVRGVANTFDGGAGVFRVDVADTTTADNGGTVIVDAAGRRWKREFSGAVASSWFEGINSAVDASAAVIKSLSAAMSSDSKTVYVDRQCVIDSLINIPDGIALTGASWRPDDISGPGFICRDNAQIVMGKRSQVSRLSIVYDEQNYTTFVEYPVTFVPDSACIIEQINYVGGTHFCVQEAGTYIEKPIIRDIYGCPLVVGIDLCNTVDTAKIDTIHFNPNSLRQVGVTEGSTPSIASVSAQMQQTAELIRLGRTDWTQISNVFSYGYKLGVHQYRRTADDLEGSGGFSIVNFGFDYCHVPFQIDRSETPFSYTINNGWATPLVLVSGSRNCFLKLTGAGTRGVTVLVNNVKAFGFVTGTNIGPAASYIVDETTAGTTDNDYNRVILSNYEFQNHTGDLVYGFAPANSDVLFSAGLNIFQRHGVSVDASGIIKTNHSDAPVGVAFLNGWSNFGSGYSGLTYFKDALGYVHVQGVIVQGNIGLINSSICQLPVGYRPASAFDAPCVTTAGAIASVRIYSEGEIQQIAGGTAPFSMAFSFRP